MADFQGRPLFTADARAGALLYLRDEAPQDAIEAPTPGVEVDLAAGSRAVIVRGLSGHEGVEILRVAPEYANQALDLFTIKGDKGLSLADPAVSSGCWWDTGTETILRLSSTATQWMRTRVSVTLNPVDAAGNPQPLAQESSVIWHDSMRYFRMSEITDDLYDAFRNVYLALEALLSRIEPVRIKSNGHPEGERAWLERALEQAASRVDLNRYLSHPAQDPLADVLSELYVTVRTSIFHAKNGRPVLLPQDLEHRAVVADAKQRYTRLYLDLADTELCTRYMAWGATHGSWRLHVESNQWRIDVTDDPSPEDEGDTDVSPLGHPVFPSDRVELSEPLDESVAARIVGETPVASLGAQPAVERYGCVAPEGLVMVTSLGGRLTMSGFHRLQCVMALRGVAKWAPRTDYLT